MRSLFAISIVLFMFVARPLFGQANWQSVPYLIENTPTHGPVGTVYDLVVWDPDGEGEAESVLVIGGYFSSVIRPDGSSFRANGICYWDGCDYHPLCDSNAGDEDLGFPDGVVYCLAVFQGDLYVGGSFSNADGNSARAIAKWSGANWSEVGGGIWDNAGQNTGIVYDLHVHAFDETAYLYVGGQFDHANSTEYLALVRWSGAAWSSIGHANRCTSYGANYHGYVQSICSDGSDLLIGGDFQSAGSTVAADTAWYDGSSWSRTSNVYGLGEDLTLSPCTVGSCIGARTGLNAVGSDGTYAWAGGGGSGSRLSSDACNPANPNALNGVERSQRVTWTDSGGAGAGPNMVQSSEFDVVMGDFYASGSQREYPPGSPTTWIHNVTKWSGSSWDAVGDFLGGDVLAIEEYRGEIFIGGNFSSAGTTSSGNDRSLTTGLARLTLQCSAADVGQQGGLPGGDGVIDSNDWIVYIDFFYDGCLIADVGVQGGNVGHDGVIDNNDFAIYIDFFFAGCP